MAYDFTSITQDFSNQGTRNEVRMRVVNFFSNEQPGQGSENAAARYRYYVETLNDGNRVYLVRPANLHYGFDFQIHVENMNYAEEGKKRNNMPKHDNLHFDLLLKKEKDPQMYQKLYSLLKKIYECNEITNDEINSISFIVGYPVDHVIKIMKWFFIEQDIRYWNYSGRNMPWSIVPLP
ncbi:MAG: hypothetical protein PQJ49_00885 [Sphaerochaetaceae bacterium]|nr:hypothetical protein [Sphaerochaetaceae bacterium]